MNSSIDISQDRGLLFNNVLVFLQTLKCAFKYRLTLFSEGFAHSFACYASWLSCRVVFREPIYVNLKKRLL